MDRPSTIMLCRVVPGIGFKVIRVFFGFGDESSGSFSVFSKAASTARTKRTLEVKILPMTFTVEYRIVLGGVETGICRGAPTRRRLGSGSAKTDPADSLI